MIELDNVKIGMKCYLGVYRFSHGKLTFAPRIKEVEITGIRVDENYGYHYYDYKESGKTEIICDSMYRFYLSKDDFWEDYNKSCREQMDMITSEYEKKIARLKKNLHNDTKS